MDKSEVMTRLDAVEDAVKADQADKATACDENIQVMNLLKLSRMLLERRDAKRKE